jgi:hypothetical protein
LTAGARSICTHERHDWKILEWKFLERDNGKFWELEGTGRIGKIWDLDVQRLNLEIDKIKFLWYIITTIRKTVDDKAGTNGRGVTQID